MGKKVLLVEDELRIREVVADYFKKDGWEVHETDNGSSAIAWFDTVYPDLVILDIMMDLLSPSRCAANPAFRSSC